MKTTKSENNNFVPVVRAMFCSDTHIRSAEDERREKVRKCFDFVNSVAAADKNYNKVDAAIFVGDSANNGRYEQFDAFFDTCYASKKSETKLICTISRNHDGWNKDGDKKVKAYYTKKTGNQPDENSVINGIHFIGISTCDTDRIYYNHSQKKWLCSQLDAAIAEDHTKPIFVFSHEHVRDTVYGSSAFDGWGIISFKNILKKYPQVIHLSGHSHYPLNDPRSIWQKGFTCVGTGAVAYMEFTVGKERTVHPEMNDECAQGWIVEVDSEGRTRLRGFDAINNAILCDYVIDDVSNPDNFAFTPDKQKASSSAPAFETDATLTIMKNADRTYRVICPAAHSTDGKVVFLYRIRVMNGNGKKIHSEYIINNYWLGKTYVSVSFTVKAKPGCKVSVAAENAYGMSSSALTATLS